MQPFFDTKMQALSTESAQSRFHQLADEVASLELDPQEIIDAISNGKSREAAALSGLCMEKILQRLWRDHKNSEPENSQSYTIINNLRDTIKDERIINYMHAIRLTRNRASHLGSDVSIDDAIDSICKLIAILDWYREFTGKEILVPQQTERPAVGRLVINLISIMESQHNRTLLQCIENCNQVQDSFEYRLLDDSLAHDIKFKSPNSRDKIYIPAYLDMLDETRTKSGQMEDRLIVFLDNFLVGMVYDNLFAGRRSENGLGVITTCHVEEVIMPIGTMGAYFVYMLTRGALESISPHHAYHYDAERNFCVYDFKEHKKDILLSMQSASSTVCNECKAQMLDENHDMDSTRFHAIDQLLRLSGTILEQRAG